MAAKKRSASPEAFRVAAFEVGGSSYSTLRRSKRLRTSDGLAEKIEEVCDTTSSSKIGSTSNGVVLASRTKSAVTRKATSPVKKSTVTSPRKQKSVTKALETPHPTPPRWREAYDTIKDMRSRIVAPVDTMGCSRAQLDETTPENQRFATLVSLMLSSQTKDEVTFTAVTKLREAIGGSLSIDAILEAEESAISEAISKVGFWRRKTQYIKQAAQKLRNEFNSDLPKTVDELCSLPGVGPKMAFLALQDAWKLNAGIGVDVHVHRITNRLGWHNSPTKTPEETRVNLESWLPLELHPEINSLLVGFGQTICVPVGPRCDQCELSSGLCPSARKVKSKSKKTLIAVKTDSGPQIKIELEAEVKTELASPSEELIPETLSDVSDIKTE